MTDEELEQRLDKQKGIQEYLDKLTDIEKVLNEKYDCSINQINFCNKYLDHPCPPSAWLLNVQPPSAND